MKESGSWLRVSMSIDPPMARWMPQCCTLADCDSRHVTVVVMKSPGSGLPLPAVGKKIFSCVPRASIHLASVFVGASYASKLCTIAKAVPLIAPLGGTTKVEFLGVTSIVWIEFLNFTISTSLSSMSSTCLSASIPSAGAERLQRRA